MSAFLDLLVDMELLPKEQREWRARAACAGMGPDLFYVERGHDVTAAKRVCARCPVWEPCLEDALSEHDREGVHGGRTEKERRVILRARRLGIDFELTPPQPKIAEPRCDHDFWCDCAEMYRRMYGTPRRTARTERGAA